MMLLSVERGKELNALLCKIKDKLKKAWKEGSAFLPGNYGKTSYFRYRETCRIQEKMILLEGETSGKTAGMLSEIAEELSRNPLFREYEIIYAVEKKECALLRNFLRKQGMDGRIEVIGKDSVTYYKKLASAKYLVTDSAFVHIFTKREGQMYLNLSGCRFDWNEEEKKSEVNKDWNEQKGFFDADYILCPDETAMKHVINGYGLQNFAKGKIWITNVAEDDNKKLARILCENFILGETSSDITEYEIPYNGRKNVVLYLGGFEKNGLTSAGVNLLHTLDRTKYNYAVIFCVDTVQSRWESMEVLPEDVGRLGYFSCKCLTFSELWKYLFWRGFRNTSYGFIEHIIERMSLRGVERIMKHCRIDTAVQFSGYQDEMIGMMQRMPCRRIIYVHSDMEQESAVRENVRKDLLCRAYRAYDAVAVVTEGMIPPTERIAAYGRKEGERKAHIVLCQNVIDDKRIRLLGEKELRFDEVTVFNTEEETLREALQSPKKKFVSVGRFSVEKGHKRLIEAFERVHKEQPETCLFLVGGHGDLWKETVEQVHKSSCPDAVYLIRYMSNPYPLLKQCDFFVLSSLYEGFGLGLAEADVLGLPCFSANITGPRKFMVNHGGLLVENSEQGIYDGLKRCLAGSVPERLQIEYEQYNAEAIEQFESLL